MTETSLFAELASALDRGAVAIRFRDQLEPTAGHRQPFQPATYLGDRARSYATWAQGVVNPDGTAAFHGGERLTITCVTVDSEPSQANRAESGIADLVERQVLDLPKLEVIVNPGCTPERPDTVPELESIRGERRFTIFDTPHREQDPLFRFGLVPREEFALAETEKNVAEPVPGFVPFARTKIGQSILTAPGNDLSALLRHTPASLVFGFWHSYGTGLTAERARLARRYTSTIIARDAQPVVGGTAKRALFNEGKDVQLTLSDDDDLLFAVVPPEQKVDKTVSVGKPSSVGAGSILGEFGERGFTAEVIEWISTVSLRGFAQTPLGEGVSAQQRRSVTLALAVLAIAGRARADLFLRSGCDLVPVPGTSVIEAIRHDGKAERLELDLTDQSLGGALAEAKKSLDDASKGAGRQLSIGGKADSVTMRLSPGYRELIDASNAIPSIFKGETD